MMWELRNTKAPLLRLLRVATGRFPTVLRSGGGGGGVLPSVSAFHHAPANLP